MQFNNIYLSRNISWLQSDKIGCTVIEMILYAKPVLAALRFP